MLRVTGKKQLWRFGILDVIENSSDMKYRVQSLLVRKRNEKRESTLFHTFIIAYP